MSKIFQELVVAFSGLVLHFEAQFISAAAQHMEDEKQRERTAAVVTGETSGGWSLVSPGLPGSLPWRRVDDIVDGIVV